MRSPGLLIHRGPPQLPEPDLDFSEPPLSSDPPPSSPEPPETTRMGIGLGIGTSTRSLRFWRSQAMVASLPLAAEP